MLRNLVGPTPVARMDRSSRRRTGREPRQIGVILAIALLVGAGATPAVATTTAATGATQGLSQAPIAPSASPHRWPKPGFRSRSRSTRAMFAGWTCSVDSSTSTTAPPRDRIRVSDPHGDGAVRADIREIGPTLPTPQGGVSVIYSVTLPSGLVATNPESFPVDLSDADGPQDRLGRAVARSGSVSTQAWPHP
jgi:hypothetical protein